MQAWVLVAAMLFGAAPEAHVLDVPYRTQLDGSSYAMANCGPTALSMVLAYYGVDASPWELRVKAMQVQHSWYEDEGGYSDSYGVFVYNLASVADESHVVHATGLWRREAARLDTLREWQGSDLRREVLADHPVIVQVQYRALPTHLGVRVDDDHYIVVHGVVRGAMGAGFVYSDPLGIGDSGPDETISENDLLYAMSVASSPRAGFALTRSANAELD
jgi:hypothetical protein